MARIAIPVTTISRDGVTGAAAVVGDPVEGHSVPNVGRVIVEVANVGTTTDHTVTFVTQATVDGFDVADRTKLIPFGETHYFADFPASAYGRELHIDVDNAELELRAYAYPA
ncbi:hypothetical protein KIK06_23470 [Nocardiopsis sp. EMB25]|uniref:hypothetical protein n=1 Tax=Nocardiopsis sp. EMB25 TaxID=2835867 RepID=UPI0022847542|nr:hypothetical protein [Nocardiopsis sp. EMB25]MCY9786847.1 hypothetical protein [Nocardiopsis sp. EMB25]